MQKHHAKAELQGWMYNANAGLNKHMKPAEGPADIYSAARLTIMPRQVAPLSPVAGNENGVNMVRYEARPLTKKMKAVHNVVCPAKAILDLPTAAMCQALQHSCKQAETRNETG